jgi:hypothetical protein
MITYQFFTTAPGAVQTSAHLSNTSCRRMSRLCLLSPAGRDGRASASEGKRVGFGRGEGEGSFDFSVVQASNPSQPSSPLLRGERRQKPIEQP